MTRPGPELYVFYDGDCPLCRRAAAVARRLDGRGRLGWLSFREGGIGERFGLDLERAALRLQVRGGEGGGAEGFAALIEIARRLPLLRPLLPMSLLLNHSGFGPRAYDWVARQRYRFSGHREPEPARLRKGPP
ncbi:MAG TPA: DCC1-like thiol-disulfide oxidoreductase family protein [Bacillota bacterium]